VITVDAVLVLNADLGPLHQVSLRHAIRMLFREVAVVHEAEPDRLIGVYPVPRVVRLVSYVVTRWRFTGGPSWSRGGVLARDHRRCAYCRGHATTIDHVLPRSRGGRNTWLNTVAASRIVGHIGDAREPWKIVHRRRCGRFQDRRRPSIMWDSNRQDTVDHEPARHADTLSGKQRPHVRRRRG
jgi:hypothetical protein